MFLMYVSGRLALGLFLFLILCIVLGGISWSSGSAQRKLEFPGLWFSSKMHEGWRMRLDIMSFEV